MNIIDKTHQYLAPKRSWNQRSVSNIKKIVVHHSATPHGRFPSDHDLMQYIKKLHTSKGWPGLSYHYVISDIGIIYKTNNHEDITWHDSVNYNSLGIMVNGYFHPDYNDVPNKRQLSALKWLLDKLCTQHPEFPADQNDVYGHRDIKPTACPGNNLYPFVTQYRLNSGVVNWDLPAPKIPTIKDTMSDLLKKYNVNSEQELDEKIESHVGLNWGLKEGSGGGYLGSSRRKVESLENRIEELEAEMRYLSDQMADLNYVISSKDKMIKNLSNENEILRNKANTPMIPEEYKRFVSNFGIFAAPLLITNLTALAGYLSAEQTIAANVVLVMVNTSIDLLKKYNKTKKVEFGPPIF